MVGALKKLSSSIFRKLTFALLAMLVVSGCNYQRMKMTPFAAKGGPGQVPWFAVLQTELFHSGTCFGCHGPGGKSGIEIHTYEQVMGYVEPGKPDDSILYIYLESGEMPKGPHKVTGPLLESVKEWIAAGASETAIRPKPAIAAPAPAPEGEKAPAAEEPPADPAGEKTPDVDATAEAKPDPVPTTDSTQDSNSQNSNGA